MVFLDRMNGIDRIDLKPNWKSISIMSNEPANPYAPTDNIENDEGWELAGQKLDAKNVRLIRVGRTFVTWEKLRLVYNLILLCVTVLTCGFCVMCLPVSIDEGDLIGRVIVGALLANLCFCLGPLIDGYLSWFGWRSTFSTSVLFLFGTLLSIVLAALSIISPMMHV